MSSPSTLRITVQNCVTCPFVNGYALNEGTGTYCDAGEYLPGLAKNRLVVAWETGNQTPVPGWCPLREAEVRVELGRT